VPLPDDYELFCQDLEEVIQDPNNFAEYHAAVPCPLPPASSQPPVAPQLPVVRQYLARFSETLALNMSTPPRPVLAASATPAWSSPDSAPTNAVPEQQLAKETTPMPQESPTQACSADSTDAGPVGPAASQPKDVTPKPAPTSSEISNLPAQQLGLAFLGNSQPRKTEMVSETGDQEVPLGTPQGVGDVPENPQESPVPHPTSLGSEHDPDSSVVPLVK
jgi:hypothetical protein